MATYTSNGGTERGVSAGRWLPVGGVLLAALLVALIAFAVSGRSGADDALPTGVDSTASPPATPEPDNQEVETDDSDSGSGTGSGSGSGTGSGTSSGSGSGTGSGGEQPSGEPLEILELTYSARALTFNPSDPGDPDFTPVPEVWISGRVIDPESPLRGKRLETARFHFGDGTEMEPHFNTNHARFRISDTGRGHLYHPSYLGQAVTLRVVMYGHAGQVETREVTVTLPDEGDETVHGSFE